MSIARQLTMTLLMFALFLNGMPFSWLMWVLAVPGLAVWWLAFRFLAWRVDERLRKLELSHRE